MANTANPLIPTDGLITISDGAALSVTVAYDSGDFQITGLTNSQKTRKGYKSRGKTYSVRDVEDQDIQFSFSSDAVTLKGDGTTGTPWEAANRIGVWAAATSTLPSVNGDSYLLQVSWTGERTNRGASNDNTITMKYCALDIDFQEGDPGKISFKGVNYCLGSDYLTQS